MEQNVVISCPIRSNFWQSFLWNDCCVLCHIRLTRKHCGRRLTMLGHGSGNILGCYALLSWWNIWDTALLYELVLGPPDRNVVGTINLFGIVHIVVMISHHIDVARSWDRSSSLGVMIVTWVHLGLDIGERPKVYNLDVNTIVELPTSPSVSM